MENRRVKTPRELRRQRLAFWAVCALLVGYALLGGDYTLYHLALLGSERDRVERRIEELSAENALLPRQQVRLVRDTLLIEQLAREKGMKRPGEIVYRLVPVHPPAPTEPDGAPEAAQREGRR